MKYIDKLIEFQSAVFQKTGNYRGDINQQFLADNPTAKLRADLVIEEANELSDALLNGTKADVLKELCDVIYVCFGIAATYNLPVEEAFEQVHINNMLKIKTGTVAKNGKFLKSKDHPKVNLNSLLDIQKEIKEIKARYTFNFEGTDSNERV